MSVDLVPYRSGPPAFRGRRAAAEVRAVQRPAVRALGRLDARTIVTKEALDRLEELVHEEARVCRRAGATADARARLLVDRWTIGAAIEIDRLTPGAEVSRCWR